MRKVFDMDAPCYGTQKGRKQEISRNLEEGNRLELAESSPRYAFKTVQIVKKCGCIYG